MTLLWVLSHQAYLTSEEMLAQRRWRFVEGHTAKQRLGSNPSLSDFNASDFP